MKYLLLHIYLCALMATNIYTQQNTTNKISCEYFTKKHEMISEVFLPGIISTDQFEFGITFSPDGKEIYFTRRPDYEGSENRIYYTKFINDKWTVPKAASFSESCFEFLPVISPDGKKIFFYSEREGANKNNFDGDLWYCDKTSDGWSDANFFEHPSNRKFIMKISVSKNGNIYFAGLFNKKRGIFVSSFINGKYTEPIPLPEFINELAPAHPFVSPDESYLIFDAQITGRGKSELFICFRQANESWTKPINMGPEINKTKTEFAAVVSPDGNYLFFHRRASNNGDIYWVSTNIIYELKPGDLK
ncbi:MAG: hypothetical protein V1720_15715 [bacterium]